jgi:hypothetical protein
VCDEQARRHVEGLIKNLMRRTLALAQARQEREYYAVSRAYLKSMRYFDAALKVLRAIKSARHHKP